MLVTHENDIAAFTKRIVRFLDGRIVSDQLVIQTSGTGQGANGQIQPPGADQKAFQEMQRKIQAGQEHLVKLNNEVLKMLKA